MIVCQCTVIVITLSLLDWKHHPVGELEDAEEKNSKKNKKHDKDQHSKRQQSRGRGRSRSRDVEG